MADVSSSPVTQVRLFAGLPEASALPPDPVPSPDEPGEGMRAFGVRGGAEGATA